MHWYLLVGRTTIVLASRELENIPSVSSRRVYMDSIGKRLGVACSLSTKRTDIRVSHLSMATQSPNISIPFCILPLITVLPGNDLAHGNHMKSYTHL